MKTTDLLKLWIDADGEAIGPFDYIDEAEAYIDDRDDHGYDITNWTIMEIGILSDTKVR